MRPCPFCAEHIQDSAMLCRFCNRPVLPVLPTVPVESTWTAPPPLPASAPKAPRRGFASRVAIGIALVLGFFLGVPLLGAIFAQAPALTAFGGLVALALPVLMLLGRRSKAPAVARALGRHPALSIYGAVLCGLASIGSVGIREGSGARQAKPATALAPAKAGPTSPAPVATALPPEDRIALEQNQAEAARKAAVAQGISESQAIIASKLLCDTPKVIGEAWQKLRQVRPGDAELPMARAVLPGLEKCRAAAERAFQESFTAVVIANRKSTAERMELALLDAGADVRVQLSGSRQDQITFSWILMNRVWVRRLTKEGDLLKNLEGAGFKRATFTDGDESWYFDLHPADESTAGKQVLGDGLDHPLKL